jgi:hypothetical protein
LIVFPDAALTVLDVITPVDARMIEGGVLEPDDERVTEARERAERFIERARSSAPPRCCRPMRGRRTRRTRR